MKKEYNSIVTSTMKTGNDDTVVEKPLYWDTLLECMNDNPGNGGDALLASSQKEKFDDIYSSSTSSSKSPRNNALHLYKLYLIAHIIWL